MDYIVALLNNHYSTLFHSLLLPSINQPKSISNYTFHFAAISADSVLKIFNSLVIGKATGPVDLSACILKMAAAVKAGSLTKLFNVSLIEFDLM